MLLAWEKIIIHRRLNWPVHTYSAICKINGDIHTEKKRVKLEPKMVHQSDSIEEPLLVPERTFYTMVL